MSNVIELNRLDSFEQIRKGFKVNFQIVCGEIFVSVSKTNSNGITCDFYKSDFKNSLQGASNYANKIIKNELQNNNR